MPAELQQQHSVYNIDFSGPFGFSMNRDSFQFIQLVQSPSQLLEDRNERQDRPGFIWFAIAIYVPFKIISEAVFSSIKNNTQSRINVLSLLIYISYVVINFFVINTAFFFFRRIIFFGQEAGFFLLAIGCLLIFNDVVKAFIWSPHTQIFNIMLPLFCLWAFIHVFDNKLFERSIVYILAALAGLGMTAYASFFLFLPSIIVPAIIIQINQKELSVNAICYFVLRSVVITILVIAPSVLWYFYVISKTGSFYSHSTEAYHHVVWMKDAYQEGIMVLLNKLLLNSIKLFVFAAKQSWVLLLVTILAFSSRANSSIQWKGFVRSAPFLGSIFISLMFLAFFSMVGTIVPRLAYTAVPPLIVLTAYWAQQFSYNKSTLTYRLIPFVVLSYGVYELVKDGPYS